MHERTETERDDPVSAAVMHCPSFVIVPVVLLKSQCFTP